MGFKTLSIYFIIMSVFIFSFNYSLCFANSYEKQTSKLLFKKAKLLLKQKKTAKAYKLLKEKEALFAGDINYDYILAMTAIDSNELSHATFIFERILTVKPNFAGARLDMARAYFMMGNHLRAKTEFEIVLSLNPPSLAKKTVKKYLKIINHLLTIKKHDFSGFVQISSGYNNNINNSTDNNTIYVPALDLNMLLSATNIKQGDYFVNPAAYGLYKYRFNRDISSYFGIYANSRTHLNKDDFNSTGINIRTGFNFKCENGTFGIGLTEGIVTLDNDTNQKNTGVELNWDIMAGNFDLYSLFVQYNSIRFPDIFENNVDQILIGSTWIHVIQNSKQPTLTASCFLGNIVDKNMRADGGNTIFGLRAGGEINIINSVRLFSFLGFQINNYDKENIAFMETRMDYLYSGVIGCTWKFSKNLSLTVKGQYSNNKSNILLYEYDISTIFINLRYDFN